MYSNSKQILLFGVICAGTYVAYKLISKKMNKIYYFGYGSNMSIYHLKNVKSLYPKSILGAAKIQDYSLSFSLLINKQKINGMANIIPDNDSCVEGVIMELDYETFNKLADIESAYKIVKLNAILNDTNKSVRVYTFIFDKECEKEYNNKGGFVRFDVNGKPEENYLDTLIVGARNNGISNQYIEKNLIKYKINNQYIPNGCFDVKNEFCKRTLKEINSKVWTWNDINNENEFNNGNLCVLKGIVLDITALKVMHESIADLFIGKDITNVYGKRWGYANDTNTISPHYYDTMQKEYVNSMVGDVVNRSPKPPFNVCVVGKLSSNEEWGFHNYNW